MDMVALYANVDKAISEYEAACQEESFLVDRISNLEYEMARYSSQAASAEDTFEEGDALRKVKEAALEYEQRQNELTQTQNKKNNAEGYLRSTRAKLPELISYYKAEENKTLQSIGIFKQAAEGQFGSSAANELPRLSVVLEKYQQALNDAYALVERIDSALDGGEPGPQKVLRR